MQTTDELSVVLGAAEPGVEVDAYQVIAVWEQTLADVLSNQSSAAYRDVFWEYIEDVTEVLTDVAITADGVQWEFVEELIEAYPADGANQPDLPDVDIAGSLTDTAITNTVGAAIVAERTATDVSNLPVTGFEYLYDTARYATDTAWEDAFCITWYLGHPDIDVEARLVELAADDGQDVFVPATLEPGFVASEDGALSLLETLFEERLIDPGPNLFQIDAAYTGRGDYVPRYTPDRIAQRVTGGLSDETVEEILGVLNDHLNPEFLEHMQRESSMEFPLTRTPAE